MAIRTNSDDVLALLNDDTIDTDLVDSLIIAASAVIDSVFAEDTTTPTALLREMERWLSAHLVASTPHARPTSEEKIGDAMAKFTGKWGEMLKSTPYGQMVLTLDTSGKMHKAGKAAVYLKAIKSFDE